VTGKPYEQEIDELYRRSDEGGVVDLPKIDVQKDARQLEVEIGQLIENVVGTKGLEKGQDFFAVGMDSLDVLTSIKWFKAALRASRRIRSAPA
jgi:hypothetical protein